VRLDSPVYISDDIKLQKTTLLLEVISEFRAYPEISRKLFAAIGARSVMPCHCAGIHGVVLSMYGHTSVHDGSMVQHADAI
jgi:hypothetical protein